MINFRDKKVTAKQWAAEMLFWDLDCLTEYYYDRNSDTYNKMTEHEKEKVRQHIQKYHEKITAMVLRSCTKETKKTYGRPK